MSDPASVIGCSPARRIHGSGNALNGSSNYLFRAAELEFGPRAFRFLEESAIVPVWPCESSRSGNLLSPLLSLAIMARLHASRRAGSLTGGNVCLKLGRFTLRSCSFSPQA